MRVRKQWYNGIVEGNKRIAFQSASTPTAHSHGGQYLACIGPFRTKRAALWAVNQGTNPHFRHVRDAERIAAASQTNNAR